MKITEILLEYRRDVTAKNLGVKLILAISRDGGYIPFHLPVETDDLRGITADRLQKWIDYPGGSDQVADLINTILEAIEAKDPTQNKQYTQWLAKMYSNGGLKLEDINRQYLLNLYVIAKRRQMIRPEHADINKFRTYKDFEDAIFPYDLINKLHTDDEKKVVNKGTSKEVYKDADVRIIVPEDEAAACYYGQGTRWCTAGDKDNRFNDYNSEGTLYIMLPKSPKYPGEKYQLHFSANQFMDPSDEPVDVLELLKTRFPNTLEFFKKAEPDMENMIIFAPDELLKKLIKKIMEMSNEYIWQIVSDFEGEDDYYIEWLTDHGYSTEDSIIDWDRVQDDGVTYIQFNDDMRVFVNDCEKFLEMTPQILREAAQEYLEKVDSDAYHITAIPSVIGYYATWTVGGGRPEETYGLSAFVEDDIRIKRQGDSVVVQKW